MHKLLLVALCALVFCSVTSFASTGGKDADKEMQAAGLSKGKQPKLSDGDDTDEESSLEIPDQGSTGLEPKMEGFHISQPLEQEAPASTSQALQPLGTPPKDAKKSRQPVAPYTAPLTLQKDGASLEPQSPYKPVGSQVVPTTPTNPPIRPIPKAFSTAPAASREEKSRKPVAGAGRTGSKKGDHEKAAAASVVDSSRFKASLKFLSSKKHKIVSRSVDPQLEKFKEEYKDGVKFQTIDVTWLSSRARIDLLKQIIEFKRRLLPATTAYEFWDVKYTDKKPTKFKLGQFTYKLVLNPTPDQLGDGLLSMAETSYSGIALPKIGSHEDNIAWITKSLKPDDVKKYIGLLFIQRKYGDPINTGDPEKSSFFNGLNLLLDFEEARHRVEGDVFENLPVVVHIDYMIKHLSEWEFNREKDRNFDSIGKILSLFMHPTYRYFAESALSKVDHTDDDSFIDNVRGEAKIRRILESLHSIDEYSDSEYSGDEIPLTERHWRFLERERARFLDTVADRYIQGMRYVEGNNLLWGGDIELGIIVNLPGIERNIIIHEGAGAPTPINADNPKYPSIHLLFNRRDLHYQVADETGDFKSDVIGDGNCLFRAVLKALETSDSLEEIRKLRNLVADQLEQRRDDIRITFEHAINLYIGRGDTEAIDDLPPGDLQDEAWRLAKSGDLQDEPKYLAKFGYLQDEAKRLVGEYYKKKLEATEGNDTQPSGSDESSGEESQILHRGRGYSDDSSS